MYTQSDLENLVDQVTRHGHFRGTSGVHLERYIMKHLWFSNPAVTRGLSEVMARRINDLGVAVDCVFGPPMGAAIFAQRLAESLGDVLYVFGDEDSQGISFRKRDGFTQLVRGRRVLLTEDVVNTGHSVHKSIACIKNAGGEVVLIAAVCDRGPIKRYIGEIPFLPLVRREMSVWNTDDCPHCQAGVPMDSRLGHG